MWRDQAACKGMDPELWFPKREAACNAGGYATAREICMTCPVRTECLDEAMATEQDAGKAYRAGMFGGMSPHQRHELRMGRLVERVEPCAVCGVMFNRGIRGKLCCSKRCQRVREAERARLYQREHRERKSVHGGIKKAKSGCRCVQCTGRRRIERLKARALAAAREAS